jgi:hypothetical protein
MNFKLRVFFFHLRHERLDPCAMRAAVTVKEIGAGRAAGSFLRICRVRNSRQEQQRQQKQKQRPFHFSQPPFMQQDFFKNLPFAYPNALKTSQTL